jgi:hypothetical protein
MYEIFLFFFKFFKNEFVQKVLNNELQYFAAVVTRTKLDANGLTIAENAVAAGYGYLITFKVYRSTQTLPYVDVSTLSGSPKITKTQTTAPSPPIDGSFKIIYDGNTSVDVPYNDDGTQLKKILTETFSFSKDLVIRSGGNAQGENGIGKYFQICFYGTKGDIPDFTFDPTKLKGGSVGTTPTVDLKEIVKGSNNIFYDPIPFELLYTSGKKYNSFLESKLLK